MYFLFILLVCALAAKFLFPCPDPTTPLSLAGHAANKLNLVIYLCCAVYSLVPAKSFQFWAVWLPIGFSLACIIIFINASDYGYAYFLIIHLAFIVIYTTIANVAVSAMSADIWVRVLVAVLCAFLLPVYTLAQAIGFSNSLC